MNERIECYTEFDYSDMVRRICEQVNRHIDEQTVEQLRARLAELGYRKCSECKQRKGYYLDVETIRNQQERIAKLTVERDAYFEMVKRVQADCDSRDELIRDMWECMSAHIERAVEDGGFGYPYSPQTRGCGESCTVNGEDCSMLLIERRMRELGIEV